MLEILQKILLGLFACALIYFPIVYRMMEKVRFHGQMCVRRMDGDLLRWIETAARLVALDESDTDAIDGLETVTEAYRQTKAGKTAEKIRLANQAYEIVRSAAIRSYGDARAQNLLAELNEIYWDFSMLAEDYNENSKKLNGQLDSGLSGFFARLFRFRPEPILADLTDLKC
jgi:hypothetical protein